MDQFRSMDWKNGGCVRIILFAPIALPERDDAERWTEISPLFPDRRRVERPGARFPALRPGQPSRQVESRVLLAEGFHVRVSDGNCGFRQTEPRVHRPRRS